MVSKISTGLSSKITNLNFFCALLVVSIHVKWVHTTVGINWVIDHFLAKGFALIAVPCFFYCSGYFLGGHCDEPHWYRIELTKRVKSLLIPFILWNVIAFFITSMPLGLISDYLAQRNLGESVALSGGRWISTIGLNFFEVPCLGPLWYVRALLVFVGFSWIIKSIFDFLKFGGLVLVVGICIALYCLGVTHGELGGFFHYGFSILGLIFFATGMFARIKLWSFRSKPLAIFGLILGLTFLILKIVLPKFSDVSEIIFIPSFMYGIWYFIPEVKLPYRFLVWSFPLYLIHRLILPYFATIIKNLCLSENFFAHLVEYFSSIVISLLITYFLKNKFPRLAIILFGGR